MKAAKARAETIKNLIWSNRAEIFTRLMIFGTLCAIILMYIRAFFGTEMSDEAFYVAEAKEALNGNIPFSYANGTQAVGFTFLLIPVEALYRVFVPDLEGVFLFTRLCFVTFKVFIWFFVLDVFKRKLVLSKALLLSALIIPLNGPILNFSYNTVPELIMFMVGCILYDVIEQDAPGKKARLVFAGIMTGVACFANPGWTIALFVFIALIILRARGKKNKWMTLLFYGLPIIGDVVFVVGAISMASGFSDFCYGFYRLFINAIPTDLMDTEKTVGRTLYSFAPAVYPFLLIFVPIGILSFFLFSKTSAKIGKQMTKKQTVLLAITVSFFLNSMYIMATRRAFMSSASGGDIRGFITVLYAVLYLAAGVYKKNKIILYIGLYQPIYSVAEIILVNSDASIWRFINAYTVIVPLIYILIINQSRLIRVLSGVLAVSVVVTLLYANYRLIYRDMHVTDLTDRVESGVFKNIYTTEARAKDFPELEEYLNSVIEEDDAYAFRDNVPFAYLMVHKGKPCEKMTWDTLQYHHGRNSPAPLFDYYRVRDMIPDKIIYIDFGKDDKLSILDEEYTYNDWVNAYYDLVEEVHLNETFFHVMVYQYNGTFDGNYQWWIDHYGSKKQ